MQKDRIPVFIITFNLLSTTRKMVEDILRLGGDPVIVDNNSTYPPLLDWYVRLKARDDVLLYRMPQNAGPRVVHTYLEDLRTWYREQRGRAVPENVFITDCDLDLSSIPDDGLEFLLKVYEDLAFKERHVKVGFGLTLEGLPEKPYMDLTKSWEPGLYKYPVDYQGVTVYMDSLVDTTFHLYIPQVFYKTFSWYGPAIRTGSPYQARHVPWYWTEETLGPEERYYLASVPKEMPVAHTKTLKAAFNL